MSYLTSHFGRFSVKTILLTASFALLTACGGGSNNSPKTGETDNKKPTAGETGNDNPTTGGTGNGNPATGGTGNGNPATGGTGNGNPATGGTGNENPTSLAEPTNLNVVEADNKLKFSWAAHSKASAYNLYYAEQSFSSINIANYQSLTGAKLVASISGTQKELNVIDFKVDTTYYFVLTAKTSSQESGISNEQSIKTSLGFSSSPSLLNDTGITQCGNYAYDSGSNTHNNKINCRKTIDANNNPVPLGQDGHYGTGKDGSQGKKLTKVTGFEGKCVQDEHTGLMWEVKQTTGLHSKEHTYTWYNPDNATNGGNAGIEGDGSSCSLSKCNTQAFVKEVNKIGWCGHKDWRLPSIEELLSIVDLSKINPSIDTTYFPNTRASSDHHNLRYFSSSTDVVNTENARQVYFNGGLDTDYQKEYKSRVRLVRTR